MIADREQIEFSDAVAGAVGRWPRSAIVSTVNGPDPMRDADRQRPVDARLAFDRQSVGRSAASRIRSRGAPPATISAVAAPIVATESGNAAMPQT